MDLLTTNPNKGGSPKKNNITTLLLVKMGGREFIFTIWVSACLPLPPATQMKSVI